MPWAGGGGSCGAREAAARAAAAAQRWGARAGGSASALGSARWRRAGVRDSWRRRWRPTASASFAGPPPHAGRAPRRPAPAARAPAACRDRARARPAAAWRGGAAAAAAAPAASLLLQPADAFAGATVLVLPVYFLMMAFPRAKLVRRAHSCVFMWPWQRRVAALLWAGRAGQRGGGGGGRPARRCARHAAARTERAAGGPRMPAAARAPCNRTHTNAAACTPPPPMQTRQLVEAPLLPLLLGIPYAILLWQAWQSGAITAVADAVAASRPLPDAAAIAGVFRAPALTALAWLHLLLLDFLAAR